MSMLLHLFKKDFRRTCVLLLLWLALVLLHNTLLGLGHHTKDRVAEIVSYGVSMIVPLLEVFVLAVLVPLVVQEEPLVGHTAFWYTRPIRRTTLLVTKALFLALLVIVPLATELVVLRINGVTLHDMCLAVPEILLGELSTLTVIAVLAALTPSFGRYAIVGIVSFVVWSLLQAAITWTRMLLNPAVILTYLNDASLIQTRGLITSCLIVAGGTSVLVNQYLTRKTKRSVVLCSVTVLAMALVATAWPWDFLHTKTVLAAMPDNVTAKVTASLRHTSVRDLVKMRGMDAPQKCIDAQIDVNGLPDGLFAVYKKAHSHLIGADGAEVPLANTNPDSQYPFVRPIVSAVEHALDGVPVANASPWWTSATASPLGAAEAETYNRYVDKPLKLISEVEFSVCRYEVELVMPLIVGTVFKRDSEHDLITDVLHEGDGIEVVLSQSNSQLVFSKTGAAVNPIQIMRPQGGSFYVLRNKKRNQIVLIKQYTQINVLDMLPVSGRLVKKVIRLPFGRERDVLSPTLDDAWLADAELVRLKTVQIGEFKKTIVFDKFVLNASNQEANMKPPSEADKASISNLKLPEHATKAQVKEYVEAILLFSQRRMRTRTDDPQIEMLCKIGPENVDILLEEAGREVLGPVTFYITTAIQKLARPEDKDKILALLSKHHELIEVVTKYNWKVEAHDTLLAALRDPAERYLPKAWLLAIASFEEPATYHDLADYLARCGNKQASFYAIHLIPGIELRSTVDAAWTQAKKGNSREILDACAMAAEFGHADALDALIDLMKNSDSDTSVKHAATLFRRYTTAKGDPEEMSAWYKANKDKLSFDAAKKKFLPTQPKS